MRLVILFFLISFTFFLTGCSSNKEPYEGNLPGTVKYDYYYPSTRRLPPEPVYSRVMWVYLPKPVGIETKNDVVFLRRIMSFELKNATLEEAVNAISQSMGFEAVYPRSLAGRRTSIDFEGSVEDALEKLSLDTNTRIKVDRGSRTISVFDRKIAPRIMTEDGN